ncbi:MAG: hypothetical protein ABL936_06055 [Aestuariivirga sp.]
MKIVAHHLQLEAHKRSASDEKDCFGRSAYNRYYYAAFLLARSALRTIYGTQVKFNHAEVPQYLETTVLKDIQKFKADAKKVGDLDLKDQCARSEHAARELARLLKSAYAVRTTADYEPEVRVVFEDAKRFTLNGLDITQAHEWPARVTTYSSQLVSVWQQFK